jgi:rhodanese-related sulfurtransferase
MQRTKEYKSKSFGAIPVGLIIYIKQCYCKSQRQKEYQIIVYCSIGVRSEQIGEKLQKLGYKMSIIYFGILNIEAGKVVNNQK